MTYRSYEHVPIVLTPSSDSKNVYSRRNIKGGNKQGEKGENLEVYFTGLSSFPHRRVINIERGMGWNRYFQNWEITQHWTSGYGRSCYSNLMSESHSRPGWFPWGEEVGILMLGLPKQRSKSVWDNLKECVIVSGLLLQPLYH